MYSKFWSYKRNSKWFKSIDRKNFNVVFKTIPAKGKYIKTLRESIKKASVVILATDDDREGGLLLGIFVKHLAFNNHN